MGLKLPILSVLREGSFIKDMEVCGLSINSVSEPKSHQQSIAHQFSNILLRVAIALIVSLVIVLIFFASGAVSH